MTTIAVKVLSPCERISLPTILLTPTSTDSIVHFMGVLSTCLYNGRLTGKKLRTARHRCRSDTTLISEFGFNQNTLIDRPGAAI